MSSRHWTRASRALARPEAHGTCPGLEVAGREGTVLCPGLTHTSRLCTGTMASVGVGVCLRWVTVGLTDKVDLQGPGQEHPAPGTVNRVGVLPVGRARQLAPLRWLPPHTPGNVSVRYLQVPSSRPELAAQGCFQAYCPRLVEFEAGDAMGMSDSSCQIWLKMWSSGPFGRAGGGDESSLES